MKTQTLYLIFGIILLIDGLASIIYFKQEATSFEQFIRILRIIIGLMLIYKNRRQTK